jgi:hypothetical protein
MRRKRRTWIVVAVLVTPIIVAFGLGPAAAGSTATSAPLQLESALAPGEVAQASGQVAEAAIQSEVTLTQSCSPLTILLGALSRCEIQVANNSFEEQVVDLDTYAR